MGAAAVIFTPNMPHESWQRGEPALPASFQMRRVCTVVVYAEPVPQGSKSAFVNPVTGRAIITDKRSKALKDFRKEVHNYVIGVLGPGHSPTRRAVYVSASFFMRRPRAHFGAKGLKPHAPFVHTVKPDQDKLARALNDALTGAAFADDSQIFGSSVLKLYSDVPGVWATVWESEA
jgi:Holliday junction resolvase RusA-like endonuclease